MTTTTHAPDVTSTRSRSATTSWRGDESVVTLRAGDVERHFRWGEPWHLGSAAYWINRCEESIKPGYEHAFGRSLGEEVAACILGGHGIPASVGLSAFAALRDQGYFDDEASPTGDDLEAALRTPLDVGGRRIRYRFAAQRGQRLGQALAMLKLGTPPDSPVALRDWLLQLPGVGPKTASWVVRNHLGSDDVAIIDVHLLRAGVIAGVYAPEWTPARDYALLERLFLEWAARGGVSAAALDAVIWADMAQLGRSVFTALGVTEGRPSWYTLQV